MQVLRKLPPFESVKDWSKDLSILSDFTFMNLLIYLVYGKDKSSDMHALKSFKSLKDLGIHSSTCLREGNGNSNFNSLARKQIQVVNKRLYVLH